MLFFDFLDAGPVPRCWCGCLVVWVPLFALFASYQWPGLSQRSFLAGCPAPSSSTSSSTTSIVGTLTLTPYFCVFFGRRRYDDRFAGAACPTRAFRGASLYRWGVPALVCCVVHITTSLPHFCLAVFLTFFPWLLKHFRGLTSFVGFLGAELHCFHWIWLRFIIVTTHFSNGPLIIMQRKFSVLRAR